MTSTTEYVNKLRQSETCKAKVIDEIAEYTLKSNVPLLKSLPALPKATDKRHVIVIEIIGNEPSLYSVLTDSNQSINPSLRALDKLIFVFLNVKPSPLVMPTVAGGYRLQDGAAIDIAYEVVLQITDAKEFWQASDDPIQLLKSKVINETRKYVMNLNSLDIIESRLEIEQGLEQKMLAGQTTNVVLGLENEVRKAAVQGIRLIEVHANISLNKQLQDLQDRRRAMIFDSKGIIDNRDGRNRVITERRDVDAIIDQDPTFTPYRLRDVIRALDMSLLENFYTMSYSDAMRKVHESYETTRQAYYNQQKNADLARLEDALARAKRTGMEQMVIDKLLTQMGEKLLESIDSDAVDDDKLRQDFFTKKLGIKPTPNLLTGDSSFKSLPDR